MDKMLPPVNQRIKNLIERVSNGNVTDFSKRLGYDKPQKVNRLFKIDDRTEKYPVPSTEMLEDISNVFDISLDQLIKGTVLTQSKPQKAVPYYDGDVTGSIVGSFNDIREDPAFYVDFKPFNDCVAYFTIYGDSMYPKFASGEIIAVKEIENKNTLQWGEAHLIITDSSENNMRTVKTIHPCDRDSSCIILRASNPNFKGDTVIRKEAIINMFLVKGKIRKDQA